MLITIICVVSGLVMIGCLIIENIYSRKKKQLDAAQLMPTFSDFSVYDYLTRIEKDGIEISREREKQPRYELVLWLVVDGLRMNDDGTTEWIRREEEKPKPVSASYSTPQQRLNFSVMQSPHGAMQALLYNSGCQNTASQIQALQAQLQNCCVSQMITEQNQRIIGAISPSYATLPTQMFSQLACTSGIIKE